MLATQTASEARRSMQGRNKLRLGLFGANCSSGRYITTAPERWFGGVEDQRRMAVLADEAGIEFLLPIGRWKGYGGETDFSGTTYETITWATGLLSATKRITVFGTVHVPMFHPLVAAKQMVTADHFGAGRFALNIVCGRNEGEFDMFGMFSELKKGKDDRYAQGQEWIEIVRRAWNEDDFDYSGAYYTLKAVREKPKPYGGTQPIIVNAGTSPEGKAFAVRNCDAFFSQPGNAGFDPEGLAAAAALIAEIKGKARAIGREIEAYTVAYVICRPTRAEAEDYLTYLIDEHPDNVALDKMMQLRGFASRLSPEELAPVRRRHTYNDGGFACIGSPDDVAVQLSTIAGMGYNAVAMTLPHYVNDLPYFCAEVLPRLVRSGLREQ